MAHPDLIRPALASHRRQRRPLRAGALATIALATASLLASAGCTPTGESSALQGTRGATAPATAPAPTGLPGQASVEAPFEAATPTWVRYHTHAQTLAILESYHARFPGLTRLDTIGTSIHGHPLVVMEVTNRQTGPAAEKPALYLDGGIHAQELTASEVVLYTMDHLLTGHGSDPRVTELLDTRAFYLHPKVNPAGSDLVLHEDQWMRSTPRPVDENGDGIPDSDPPMDLDGDGRILQMRIPDPDGNRVADADDPRIMSARTPEDTGPFYRVEREGIDANGDGRIASDGIGGSDMNRNFPYNWAPLYRQPGAYNFPLSEPETWALANFVNDHPNITQIIHGHTSGGFIYRLPSASNPATFDTVDLALIEDLGAWYTEDTGRRVIPSATDPVDHRYGTFISFAYFASGIVGWVPEYWPGPTSWVPAAADDGRVTEADWHRANDERFGGAYFTDWTPFDHPQLGPVEIGGWHTKYWSQNPPYELLEEELRTQLPWILEMAARSPLVTVSEPRFEALDDARVAVEVTVTNTGWLATHLTQRGAEGNLSSAGEVRNPVVPESLAILEVDGGRPESGNGRIRFGHLAGSNPHTNSVREQSRTLRWIVVRGAGGDADAAGAPNASAPRDLHVNITISTAKGGTVRTEGSLQPPE
ncbi:M14 family metallopeptidase [soil metagenome]